MPTRGAKKWRKEEKRRRAIRRTRWVLGMPSSAKSQRGLLAEQAVFEALEYHRQKKTEFPGGRRIEKIVQTIHFSLEDQGGVDIIVYFRIDSQEEMEALRVQVQNWWTWEAEEEFREKGICLIVVWLFYPDRRPKTKEQIREEARKTTLSAISKFYSDVLPQAVPVGKAA